MSAEVVRDEDGTLLIAVDGGSVRVDAEGRRWLVLPPLTPDDEADLAGALLRAAVGPSVAANLVACAQVGLECAPDDAGADPDAVFELLKRWDEA